VIEPKQVAKSLGFSRIKPQGKQHIFLKTLMKERLKFMGSLKANQRLENLLDYFRRCATLLAKSLIHRGVGISPNLDERDTYPAKLSDQVAHRIIW
jgi:hypothetical protein